jgi:myo-inositol-1(or 4)-monophosphatase
LAELEQRSGDLALLIEAAHAAGAMLRSAVGAPVKVWNKGAAGPVTEVDLAVDRHLRERLLAARPDYGWLSEETADTAGRLHCRRAFVVDPLDGTRSFIKKDTDFCTALAIVEDGCATVGVIYAPVLGEIVAGAVGLGATLNGATCETSRADSLDEASMVGPSAMYAHARWPRPWPKTMRTTARAALAYRMALVACGRADGMVAVGAKHEWDIAAGAALIEAAGGAVSDSWGRALVFNKPIAMVAGVTAAGANLHPLLIERTALLPAPQ